MMMSFISVSTTTTTTTSIDNRVIISAATFLVSAESTIVVTLSPIICIQLYWDLYWDLYFYSMELGSVLKFVLGLLFDIGIYIYI